MSYRHNRSKRSRRLRVESFESRLCLSAVGFVEHHVACCETEGVDSVAAADFDGDGDLDVASASRVGNVVVWYENADGLGTFEFQQTIDWYDGVWTATSLAAGDLDGDGDSDLAFAGDRPGTIAWYENVDGRGGFGRRQEISTNVLLPLSLLTADLDGDGDLDLLSGSGVDTITWFENTDGLGTFAVEHVVTTVGESPRSVTISDLDGDGDSDIVVVAHNADTVLWYQNVDGRGNFGSSQAIVMDAVGVVSVATADVDGDGDQDVFAGGEGIEWYENDGRGQFHRTSTIDADLSGIRSLAPADVDGDGDIDLVNASTDQDLISWHENSDGRGNFMAMRKSVADADGANAVIAVDLDKDGDVDTISASFDDDRVAWHQNADGLGAFRTQLITPAIVGMSSTVMADIDSDGNADVIVSTGHASDGGQLVWYKNLDGMGTFDQFNVIAEKLEGPGTLLASDVDADRDLDLLFFVPGSHSAQSKLTWFENRDGKGQFADPRLVLFGDFDFVDVSDIDGDGDPDVLASGSRTLWYENTDGQGTFGRRDELPGSSGVPSRVSLGDVDRDGDMDVMLAALAGDRTVWHENTNSRGDFSLPRIIASDFDATVTSFLAADLDSDQDLDILVGSSSHEVIAWYENVDGQGSFGAQQKITESRGPHDLATVDLDGDGDLDLLSSDNELVWYENIDGQGRFDPRHVLASDPFDLGRAYLATGDIDGDSDSDVLWALPNRLAWYETRLMADVNDDGQFDSSDLVDVFRAGEYADQIVRNSTFDEGDWNGDGEFDTGDLVLAFQSGTFVAAAQPTPFASAIDFLFAQDKELRHGAAYVA